MPELSFERFSPFSTEQMLSLVADIKSYPEFVPNCADMQVEAGENENISFATMSVQLGPIEQTYTSEVIIDKSAKTISATAIDGPFSYLESIWQFIEQDEGSLIRFDIDFGFSNPLLGRIAEPIFAQKQEEILDAFIEEAKRRFS
ncbi:MAG: type II toxin-antitoxin system RatA family toxin [Devosiaceae bacterium]|nr:type II toxin-antitoxin system RatA family toxin [Devosiaceae bacterium]